MSTASSITTYLFCYNALSASSWLYTFLIILRVLASSHLNTLDIIGSEVWLEIEIPLKVVQTFAALEILHSLFGFVRSDPVTVFLQVSSRLGVLWGICNLTVEGRNSFGFLLMVCSWCLVEIPRYSFYALNLVGARPYFLLWLRYSMFLILYPTGITGELWCIWSVLPYLSTASHLNYNMPNVLNIGFNYKWCVLLIAVCGYIPGAPFLFSHMQAERKKQLGKVDDGKEKSK